MIETKNIIINFGASNQIYLKTLPASPQLHQRQG